MWALDSLKTATPILGNALWTCYARRKREANKKKEKKEKNRSDPLETSGGNPKGVIPQPPLHVAPGRVER
jgi:hypothetical protein